MIGEQHNLTNTVEIGWDELLEKEEERLNAKRRAMEDIAEVLEKYDYSIADWGEFLDWQNMKNRPNGDYIGKGADLIRLSNVPAVQLRWLWPGKIPTGKLTLLVGDPGLGKSVVTLDLTARVTIGTPWPDGSANDGPGDVIILSAEDDPSDTIRPRLEAMGADLDRSFLLRCIRKENGSERMFSLADDLNVLKECLDHLGSTVKLVIIDPISAYLGNTDSHIDASVRSVLAPLAELAGSYETAVLGVAHLNKGQGAAIYRVQGLIAFTAAARAVWAVGKDTDDETGRRRLLLPVKCNLAPDVGGISYTLDDVNGIVTVHWGEVVSKDVHELMNSNEELGAREEAARFLEELLSDGPVLAVEAFREARKNGIKERTLNRAKKQLGVISRRKHEQRGVWEWLLSKKHCQDCQDFYPGKLGNVGNLTPEEDKTE